MNTRKTRTSLIALASLAAWSTAANAELFQLDFTSVYKSSGIESHVIQGTFVWDSETLAFSNIGNSRYWEYISFEADVMYIDSSNTLTEGTITDPGLADFDNSIRTNFVSFFEFSNINFHVEILDSDLSIFGGLTITLGGVDAMSLIDSPLPATASEYIPSTGFNTQLQISSSNSIMGSIHATVKVYEPPTPECLPDLNNDGVLDFFDVSAYLTAFSNGCP